MEMVLRLRMSGVSAVHCERVVRASLLIVLSGILYCCIRMYGGDVRMMSEDAEVYGGTMMKCYGLSGMEAEHICRNVSGASMEEYGKGMKNIAKQRVEEYRQSMEVVGRVDDSGSMKRADTGKAGLNLWNFSWTEKLGAMEKLWPVEEQWSGENIWEAGIAKPEASLDHDLQNPGDFSGILEDNDGVDAPFIDVPPIQEDGADTDKVDEIREIGGFFVDSQGYIVGITEDFVLIDGILAISSDSECVGIKADAFENIGEDVFEVYIPANICEIEQGVFDGFANLMYIEVADGNPSYESKDGILYTKSGEEMAYPKGR